MKTQRGSVLAPQLVLYGAIAGATLILTLSGLLWYQTKELKTAQGFVVAAKTLGEAQEKESKRKDKENEAKLKVADTARNVALDKLRQRPRTGGVSSVPRTPGETKSVCYSREGLDEAIRRFTAGTEAIAIEGNKALIDNKAWLESWPK